MNGKRYIVLVLCDINSYLHRQVIAYGGHPVYLDNEDVDCMVVGGAAKTEEDRDLIRAVGRRGRTVNHGAENLEAWFADRRRKEQAKP